MEMSGLDIPLAIIFLPIVAVLLYMYGTWPHSFFKSLNIPGPKPWPFVGNLFDMFSYGFHEVDFAMIKKYGKVYGVYNGRSPLLICADTDMLKDVFVKDFSNFSDRLVFMDTINPPMERAVFFLPNPKWKEVRNILTPTFSSGKLRQMTFNINACAETLTSNMVDEARKGNSVQIKQFYGAFTMDVIARIAFGLDIESQRNPSDPFVRHANAILDAPFVNLALFVAFIFPSLQRLIKHFNVRFWPEESVQFFRDIVSKTIEDRKNDSEVQKNTDFLQLMLNAEAPDSDDNSSKVFKQNDLAKCNGIKFSQPNGQLHHGQNGLNSFVSNDTTSNGHQKQNGFHLNNGRPLMFNGVSLSFEDSSALTSVSQNGQKAPNGVNIKANQLLMGHHLSCLRQNGHSQTNGFANKERNVESVPLFTNGISKPAIPSALSTKTKKLTTDDIIAQAFIFFLAGFETTATTLQFATYNLAVHPIWQERVVREIVEELGDEMPHCDNVTRLHILDQVVCETLRLYAPISRITRIAASDTVLKGVHIPAGTAVLIPIHYLHRDPEIYPEPDLFKPERFSLEERSKRNPVHYLPFGYGPRQCIGNRLGILEVKIALVNILRKCKFSTCDETEDKLEFKCSDILMTKRPIILTVEERK